MDGNRPLLNTRRLWVMLLLACLYGGIIHFFFVSPARDRLVGSIGVLLGLYICSHPAANAVDLIFFQRGAFRQHSNDPAWIGWLLLNFVVMLAGWIVILIGTTRLTGRILY